MILAVALLTGAAQADQKLGVDVYPGAEFVSARSAATRKAAGVDASCYRTRDGIGAVTTFYSRLPGFVSVEPHVLRRGKVDVVLSPPTPNSRTGAGGSYTGFCIMQAKE